MNAPANRRVKWLALGASLALLPGCLIIPVDYHVPGSRQNVREETQGKLQPGVTSKEDVLLRLGEPDFVSEDGQHFGYTWTKAKILIATYNAGDEIIRSYLLEVSFNTNNLVSQVRLLKEWGPQVSPEREDEPWPKTPSGAGKL